MTNLLIAAGFAALTVAQPVTAQTIPLSKSVSYADLDLSSASGRATLDARVRRAAMQVCEVGVDDISLVQRNAAKACFKSAVSSARQQYASIEARRTRVADRLR